MADNNDTTEGFSEAWLTLREPADHRSRSQHLTQSVSSWATQQDKLRCVELGAGTGSNLRYLCPLLGHGQQWTLIDKDPKLLEKIPHFIKTWAEQHLVTCTQTSDELQLESAGFSARVAWIEQDLAHDLASLRLDQAQLVCASALLDLASADWLAQLVSLCIDNDCATLFVLSYNGHISWNHSIAEDTLMNELLNAHQLTDKGFGNALGPEAGQYVFQLMSDHGRQLVTDESNWIIDHRMSAMQMALIEGWACAAREQDSSSSAAIESWRSQRLDACRAGESILTVGHNDLLSLPKRGIPC